MSERSGVGLVLVWLAAAAALLPAATLTVARIIDPGSSLGVQLEAFTPYALPLYVVALLVTGVAAARWAGRRRRLLVGAGLALAGMIAHGWWFAPQVLGGTPEPAAGGESTVVMTSNLLKGEADADELVEAVRSAGADILVANEITPTVLDDMEGAGLDELLPHRVGKPDPDVEGTMVFARGPVELVTMLDTELDSMVVDVDGQTIMAVHPSSPLYIDDWHTDHDAILAAAREYRPRLIAGDFNATPDHPPLRRLRDAGYRDAAEITNSWQPTWPANGHFPLLRIFPPLVPIDHVLVDDSLTVLDTRTVQLDGTDHRPVIAEVAPRA